ncbi:MAG: helix-turn-helix domain-containing protein, partial [Pseudomonadota bacterium]
ATKAIIAMLVEKLPKSLDASRLTLSLLECCAALPKPLSVGTLQLLVNIASQNLDSNGQTNIDIVRQLVLQSLQGDTLAIADIAKNVARALCVRLADMRAGTRQANIVRARGLAIVLARRLTPASLQQIGEYFGGRDHSTILHAFRKTESLLEYDNELAKTMAELQVQMLRR